MKNIFKITHLIIFLLVGISQVSAAEKVDLLKTDWSFKGLFEMLLYYMINNRMK